MGKLWDRLADEAVTFEQWCAQEKAGGPVARTKARETLRAHLKGRDTLLPPPYNRRNPGLSEGQIQKACLEELKRAGIWALRIDQVGKMIGTGDGKTIVPGAHTGLGDVLACHRGQLVSLEVKAPGGRLSAIQKLRLEDIQKAGGKVAIVVDSSLIIDWIEGRIDFPTAWIGSIPVL